MPSTLLHDARTGEDRRIYLDASFGCKPKLRIWVDPQGHCRGQSPLSVVHQAWTVRWDRAPRYQTAPDAQEANFRFLDTRDAFVRSLRRKGYRKIEVEDCAAGWHEFND